LLLLLRYSWKSGHCNIFLLPCLSPSVSSLNRRFDRDLFGYLRQSAMRLMCHYEAIYAVCTRRSSGSNVRQRRERERNENENAPKRKPICLPHVKNAFAAFNSDQDRCVCPLDVLTNRHTPDEHCVHTDKLLSKDKYKTRIFQSAASP